MHHTMIYTEEDKRRLEDRISEMHKTIEAEMEIGNSKVLDTHEAHLLNYLSVQ